MRNHRESKLYRLLLLTVLFYCAQSCNQQKYTLKNAPEGYVFTTTDAQQVAEVSASTIIQLRNIETQKPILQFGVSGSINFKHLVIDQDLTRTAVRFEAMTEKYGINGKAILFSGCQGNQNAVRICPGAIDANTVFPSCAGEVILTAQSPTFENYKWVNSAHATREDCAVETDLANLDMGTGGTLLLSYGFSFHGPLGTMGTPECSVLCEAPQMHLDGVDLVYDTKFSRRPSNKILEGDSLAGAIFSLTRNDKNPRNPDYLTRYFGKGPHYQFTYRDEKTVSIDMYGYNFLLANQQTAPVRCDLQCTSYTDADPWELSFFTNSSKGVNYTITGYDTDNVYFVNPANLTKLAGIDGGIVGTDTLVITDGRNSLPLLFKLGEGSFAQVKGFEVLDLDNNVENSVTLSAERLLAFSDSKTLRIMGTELDTVHLTDLDAWTKSTVTIKNINYQKLQNGSAVLLLQKGILLSP